MRFDGGSWFDYAADARCFRKSRAFNPADVAGYDSFMREAEFCYQLGFENMADKAFDTLGDLLSACLDAAHAGLALAAPRPGSVAIRSCAS